MTAFVAAAATVLAGLPGTDAQSDPEFRWLSPPTWSGSSKALLRDLQAAADRGYRLVPLPPAGSLLLVRKSADGPEPVEYIFAAGKQRDEKAAIGYRLVNNFVMVRSRGNTTRTHEYGEAATRLRQSMEDELRVAAGRGFRVVGLGLRSVVGLKGLATGVDETEFVAILERPVQAVEAAHPAYIVLSSLKAATMQAELQAAADRGYRLLPFEGSWGATTLLEKTGGGEPIEYLTLSTARTATMQAEMDKASSAGYRFAGTFGSGFHEFVVVMQRAKGVPARTHEQILVATTRLETLKRESLPALERGFRVVGLTDFAPFSRNPEMVAILERPIR